MAENEHPTSLLSFHDLPQDVIVYHILPFLSHVDISHFGRVCQSFRSMATSEDLWSIPVIQKHFFRNPDLIPNEAQRGGVRLHAYWLETLQNVQREASWRKNRTRFYWAAVVLIGVVFCVLEIAIVVLSIVGGVGLVEWNAIVAFVFFGILCFVFSGAMGAFLIVTEYAGQKDIRLGRFAQEIRLGIDSRSAEALRWWNVFRFWRRGNDWVGDVRDVEDGEYSQCGSLQSCVWMCSSVPFFVICGILAVAVKSTLPVSPLVGVFVFVPAFAFHEIVFCVLFCKAQIAYIHWTVRNPEHDHPFKPSNRFDHFGGLFDVSCLCCGGRLAMSLVQGLLQMCGEVCLKVLLTATLVSASFYLAGLFDAKWIPLVLLPVPLLGFLVCVLICGVSCLINNCFAHPGKHCLILLISTSVFCVMTALFVVILAIVFGFFRVAAPLKILVFVPLWLAILIPVFGSLIVMYRQRPRTLSLWPRFWEVPTERQIDPMM